MDPETEAELRADVASDLAFEAHAKRVAELSQYLGLPLNPEDPRTEALVGLIDDMRLGPKTGSLMLAAKAQRQAQEGRMRYSEDALFRFIAQHAERLRRPLPGAVDYERR